MDPASTLPRIGPLITGPPIMGIFLNWWLFGILLIQYYIYFNHARQDRKVLRAIVHFLMLLDTVQTCMTMADAFHWFVYNYGDYTKLFEFRTASINSPFIDAIIALIVQLVYCWRVWVLSKWRVIPAIAALLAVVACVNGMFIGIHDAIIKNSLGFKPVFRISIYLWCFTSAITDIIIALSMAHLLSKFKSRNSSQDLGSIIKRILLLVLETNAVTAAAAIAITIIFLVTEISPPQTNVYLAGGYVLGKLYSNCFMVLLNQRLSYSEERPQSLTVAGENGRFTTGRFRDRQSMARKHESTRHHAHGAHQNRDLQVRVSVVRLSDPITPQDVDTSDDSAIIEMGSLNKGTSARGSQETV